MDKKMSYRILTIGLRVGLGLVMSAGIAKAQAIPRNTPSPKQSCIALVW